MQRKSDIGETCCGGSARANWGRNGFVLKRGFLNTSFIGGDERYDSDRKSGTSRGSARLL